MNQNQFKYPVSHMCLAGAVVASWSLTQEVTGSNPFTVMTNIFVTVLSQFRKVFRENSIVDSSLHFPLLSLYQFTKKIKPQ